MRIEVAVENTSFAFETNFFYKISKEQSVGIFPGTRVLVPFGKKNSLRLGFVIRVLRDEDDCIKNLKEIHSVVDNHTLLDDNAISLAFWISKYYMCTYYEAFSALLPRYIKSNKKIENFSGDFEISEIILSVSQNLVYEQILDWYFDSDICCSLLYGVTGSGKTSLFLKLAQKLILQGKNVMILVPEISLSSQMIITLEKYFGKNSFACVHSGLSKSKRELEWWKIKKKMVKLVFGTRSAVLTPFIPDLIVIDEEQESTYKSDKSPRYNAIEVAKFFCKKYGSKLLISSATPSIKSFYYAKLGKIGFFELKKRYGGFLLPETSIVNISKRCFNEKSILSDELVSCINKSLEAKNQVILLLDRRGVHTIARCSSCGMTVKCRNCSTTLSHHFIDNEDIFVCHYCGFVKKILRICPNCKESGIIFFGVGTQCLEQEINRVIQGAKCIRVDADTTKSKCAYDRIFKDFKTGKYNIMLGTRMVAKGLNFENVNLVGIICADQTLFGEGYKAYEKTFALISQAVGRSGRCKKGGQALIQTFSDNNDIIEMAAKQDYNLFFEREIQIRKSLLYPPFADICTIGFISKKEKNAWNSCLFFFEALKFTAQNEFKDIPLKILAPTPAFYVKIANKFRFKIVIKCKIDGKFREFLNKSRKNYEDNNKLNRSTIDNKYKIGVHIFFDINSEGVF